MRWLFILGAGTLTLFSAAPAAMGTDEIQFDEIMAGANGDSTIQFVEIKYKAGGNDWGPRGNPPVWGARLLFYDATGSGVGTYEFPSDPPAAQGSEVRSALIATQSFADLGIVTPTFIMDPMIVASAGAVAFEYKDPSSNTNLFLAYGGDVFDDDVGLIPYAGSEAAAPSSLLPITDTISLKRFRNFGNFGQSGHSVDDFKLMTASPKVGLGLPARMSKLATIVQGETLFHKETFLGNGRTCHTCHREEDGYGLNPSTIKQLHANNFSDHLFIAEHAAMPGSAVHPSLAALENPCLMVDSCRGLFLANVDGFDERPVFRSAPHLMNVGFTGRYGWSPSFGGAITLGAFTQGAIKQHFPSKLPRNLDPGLGPLTQRTATLTEQEYMREFMTSIRTRVPDGTGPDGFADLGTDSSSNQDRDENLDRLISAYLDCGDLSVCGGTRTACRLNIQAGREFFFRGTGSDARCVRCHFGPFLHTGEAPADSGAANFLIDPDVSTNRVNDEVCGAPLAVDYPLVDPTGFGRAFIVRPLIDIARVRETFFHAGESYELVDSNACMMDVREGMRRAVEFYRTPAFLDSLVNSSGTFDIFLQMTDTEIEQVTDFLMALVEVPNCTGACCRADLTCEESSRSECLGECESFSGGGTTYCTSCAELRACCIVGEPCRITSSCACEAAGGIVKEQTSCSPDPC